MSEKKKDQAVADGSAGKKGKESGAKTSKKDGQAPAKPAVADLSSRVSSLNDWEHADLGDDSRKNKFLRLMGAAKADNSKEKAAAEAKPSSKKFVTDAHKVEVELEEQFKEGLEHTLVSGHKGHVGLGFHEPAFDAAAATEPKPRQNKITKFDDDAIVVGIPNNDIAGPNRAEEYSDDDSGEGDAKAATGDQSGEACGGSSKRSTKRSKKPCATGGRDDVAEDGKRQTSDDAPAARKKAKGSVAAAAKEEHGGEAGPAGKVKVKPASAGAAAKKSSRMPAGFVKALDA